MTLCAVGLHLNNGTVEYMVFEWSDELEKDLDQNFDNRDKIIDVFRHYSTSIAPNYYSFFNHNNDNIEYYYFFTNNRWHIMSKKNGITYPKPLKKVVNGKNNLNELDNMMDNFHF